MIPKRIRYYSIFLYNKETQEFGVEPVLTVPHLRAAMDAAKAYTWWKLCERHHSGGLTRFNLIHPVADNLSEIE